MITKSIQLQLFEDIKNLGHVTWVKLPAFMIPWMFTRYGFPCVLPSYNQLARVMREGLTRNQKQLRMHDCSMTDNMMRHNTLNISDEDKFCFIPLAMPSFYMVGKVNTRTNSDFQINEQKTVEFRKEVRYQFFQDLNEYIHDTMYKARIHNKHITFSRQLSDWMTSRGIDDDYYETIERQYRKDMNNAKREIEDRLQNTDFNLQTNERQILEGLRQRQQSGRGRFLMMRKKIQERNERNDKMIE